MKETTKDGLHSRNRFRSRYDFPKLIASSPALAEFVKPNAYGDESITFADPKAVKALNQALLKHAYGLQHWDLPPGYLCPPIPGRSDYLHHLADLIDAPRGRKTRVLDVGMGANCIYPLIGASEYGWTFVGTEIDPVAFAWAKKLAAANASVSNLIECRLQSSPLECFQGIIQPSERFDAVMCNPPFHTSAAEAAEGSQRKQRNLGNKTNTLNFGGQASELWCEGGELAFIRRMITQSVAFSKRCRCFTALVSKGTHLTRLEQALQNVRVTDMSIIDMAHGQKQSRILAWTFLTSRELQAW